MKGLIIAICIAMCFATAFAQDVPEFPYIPKTAKESEPIDYDHIREADVFWSKRVHRVIDVREKMNLPFKYPKQPLIEVIHSAVLTGEIDAYENLPNSTSHFDTILGASSVSSRFDKYDTLYDVINPITFKNDTIIVPNPLSWDKIIKYRIMEDWFFDEETSSLQVRILGIAPVMEAYTSSGTYIGDETMYWIYYPHLRDVLAKETAFNPLNYTVKLSWENVFEARLFSSYITMESNVHDRYIQEYASGVDALLESDRITDEIFAFEHDLWSY